MDGISFRGGWRRERCIYNLHYQKGGRKGGGNEERFPINVDLCTHRHCRLLLSWSPQIVPTLDNAVNNSIRDHDLSDCSMPPKLLFIALRGAVDGGILADYSGSFLGTVGSAQIAAHHRVLNGWYSSRAVNFFNLFLKLVLERFNFYHCTY